MKPPLTRAQVEEILALRGTLHPRDVGQIYSRATETIRRIWRGEVYTEVPREETAPPSLTLPGEEDEAAEALLRSLTTPKDPAP